ncbi:MAG TPA: 16S rRNA (guanine(527)-N(7))-methyltransferase RsmG [Treponema sp.]|nr:16S rRNA (guanine(527)-N(7))-methyltransferase RsmG [Treponema sp.]
MTDKLTEGLIKLDFTPETAAILAPKMESYIKELQLFNSAYNLVNTDDRDELVVRHVLDSLAPWKLLKALAEQQKSDTSFGDIGSGGGLPGIPLAAAFPQHRFTLVERMDKRCAFLENCAAVLGLKNVSVLKSEAENVKAGSFGITVFRAFRPLDKKMIKTLLALTADGGYLAAYKAKRSNIDEEMNGIKDVAGNYKIEKLSVPYLQDTERNLVIIKK